MAGEWKFWFLQFVTGAILVALILTHLSLFIGNGYRIDNSYSEIQAHLSSPAWAAFYIIFLTIVLYHSHNGLRNILSEWTGGHHDKLVTAIVIVLGVVFWIIGMHTILYFLVR